MKKDERLVIGCKEKNKKILGCDTLNDGEQEDCEYRTKHGYCAYPINNFNGEMSYEHSVFDKLGQLEDAAEQKKK